MGGWCKERYNKNENNKLEGLHQKSDQMEETRWEGQNFSEVVAPQEEEEKGLCNDTICRKYGTEEETSVHILCECDALASLRHAYLGSFFLDPEDIRVLGMGVIWNFVNP